MEAQILHSVRHLDLRSVKEHGQEKLRGMLSGRRSAVAHISSVTPGPGAAGASAGSPSGRRYTGSAATAAASGGRVGAQQRREEQAGSEAAAAAAAAAAATTAALAAAEQELLAAQTRAAQLEGALQGLCTSFAGYVGAVEAADAGGGGGGGAALPQDYFTVTFPAGAIGMILQLRSDGAVVVAELKDDKVTGAPLLAKLSGKIRKGDTLVAINDRLLARYGSPTLDFAATEFKQAARPVCVLFKR